MLTLNHVDRLDLGICGENAVRTITIDCFEWLEYWPNGTISIWHQRHGETGYEPTGATFDQRTGVLTWTPSAYDTYYAGDGRAQIRLTEGGTIRKYRMIKTLVHGALVDDQGDPVESSWQEYVDVIEGYKNAAQTAQTVAEDAQEAAETAQGKAEDAQEAAETAQGKAEDAQEAAETAQEKAELAQGAAETAKAGAEEAAAIGAAAGVAEAMAELIDDTSTAADKVWSAQKSSTRYEKPAGGIPLTDLASAVRTEINKIATRAPISHPSFTGSISLGRSGNAPFSGNTIAVGTGAKASGQYSQSFGQNNRAEGLASHAIGTSNQATAENSAIEGYMNVANGANQHVSGRFNDPDDNVPNFPSSNVHYYIGDLVKRNLLIYRCNTEHDSMGVFTASKWDQVTRSGENLYVEIVGNGSASNSKGNARTTDWLGNGEFAGDVKAGACGGEYPVSLKETASALVWKVNKFDIANNLTTQDEDKVLSAKQGYVLNAAKYEKPSGGIPASDLAASVQGELDSVELLKKPQYIVPVDLIENPTLNTSTAGAVINDALEYASENGFEEVVLPPGEYLINETIYLQDDVILKGSGTASTKLKIATGYNIDCIRVDHPVHDAGIKDLTIDGNKIDNYSYFHQSTEHGNAINVWLHRGIIENVRTEYVYKHALLMNYDVGSGTADGLGFDPEDEYRQGNLNKVMHCNFDNSTLEGVMWGWRTMDSWFCYNNIGSNGANLYLEGGTSRFIGNHFDGDGDDGVGPEYNVFCPNGCNTMLFEGNIFENTKKHNIYFQQPSYNADASYGIQIINNIIRTGSKAQDATYNLIEISGYSDGNKNHDIVISGNSLLNPDLNGNQTLYGIHLSYCDDVTIGNNTFFNIAEDNVKIESNCSNIYVDGIDDTAGSGEKQKTWSANRLSALNSALNAKQDAPETAGTSGQVLSLDNNLDPVWTTPQSGGGSVSDVQVNGTSVVTNGVANVPVANTRTLGVSKVDNYGLTINNQGVLHTKIASSSEVKAGTNSYNVITPYNQHISVFYGLAKAAGADMASVSVAVGYPEAQRVAIQKMLGIYQAPWELIREDTVTNATEADIEITVDGNGNSFELTDLRIVIISPVQQTQFKKADGRVSAYYSQNDYDSVYIGAYTQNANDYAKNSFAIFEQNNGMVTKYYMRNTTLGDNGALYAYSQTTGMFYLDNRVYTKVLITKVTGKLTYKLFGRRKWT